MNAPGKARRELISQRTREAIRETMSNWTLREIDQLWQDELFPPAEDPEPVGGQRVTHFQGYLNLVDWSDPGQVSRAIRVFEEVFRSHIEAAKTNSYFADHALPRIRRLLERDGYKLEEDGRITGRLTTIIEEGFLARLTDSGVIQDHLNRIGYAVEKDDSAQVIGSAKELIESTAKLVLKERNEGFSDKDDLPELVRRAQLALDVHPSSKAPGPDGSDAVKKILGATVAITSGITELRNRGYGTGHGPGATRTSLSNRHARLAINASKLWCEFMLDTLSDKQAPWRHSSTQQGSSAS